MPENPLKLKRIHHIEFWVGNARQASYFYRKGFGFSQVAYKGLETGERRETSYALRQGKAAFLLTTPMDPEHPAAEHLRRHGDGVRDIALEVEDADEAFAEAVRRGAKPAEEPQTVSDNHGSIRRAAIHTYGDTLHSLISTRDYAGPFLPGFSAAAMPGDDAGILRVDHVVGNVELGKMQYWADYYSDVFGFHRFISFDDKDISTEYSALMSIVMSDDSHSVKFPINEPAPGRKKSQIDEYLETYRGPGVQHIALECKDALHTVSQLEANGVEFLRVPHSYYDMLPERVGRIDEPIDRVESAGLLVDRDHEGYLLQVFSRPVEDRPALFFEIIQRKGSQGFGRGNFKALFEAIELEQARRGNL
ncbi:MAG: 4-hydroxyphenylpyruvate dioxygenase [Terriglobia bacterium]